LTDSRVLGLDGGILLSAVVITRNEERNIERCLRSLQFADELMVVDALSEDRTVGIATGLGARVIHREWPGFADQKQFAIDQAKGDWVLLVDADEEVTEALATEIEVTLAGGPKEPGFRLQRKNQFLGKWIDYGPWANDFQIRLFRKEKGRIARRPVHEGVQIDGEPGTLRSPLNHYTHQTLTESIHRLNVYTTLEAAERVSRRKIRVFDVIFPPAGVFMRYYFSGCWRAGVQGFLLAATTAMYKSILYLKILLLQRDRDAQKSA
jgi:glycosyltransferase involved in cell wall biosynthesis